jgi:hypothetical protein
MGPGAEGFVTGDPPDMEAAASAGTAAAAAAERFGGNAAVQAAAAGEAASNALPPGATPVEHAKIALQAAEDASKAAGGTELQIAKAKLKAYHAAKEAADKEVADKEVADNVDTAQLGPVMADAGTGGA